MEFGVLIGDMPTASSPREHLDAVLRQAVAAQRNGFTLLGMGQHVLYGDVRWLQPIPTLARLAAEVDEHVRLATTVLVAPIHHPVLLAEELATLDIVTDGRLVAGLGMGYRAEEFRQMGIPYAERSARFEEAVAVIRGLWAGNPVTWPGRFWQLDAAEPHLVPIQRPRPPIWIGASSEAGVRRSARLGDAWPIGPRIGIEDIQRHLAVYDEERSRWAAPVERHPIRREIVVASDRRAALNRFVAMTSERFAFYTARGRGSLSDGGTPVAEQPAVLGTPDDVVTELEGLERALPIGPVIVRVQWPGMSVDDVERYLDELGRHVVGPLRSDAGSGRAGT